MQILHIIHSLDPREGGPSTLIRELVRAQVESGDDVTVLANTVQSDGPWAPRDEYARRINSDPCFSDVEIVLSRSFGRSWPWNRFAYAPYARSWLDRRLCDRACRPDVVHIHCVFSHLTTLATGLARKHRVPYVLSPHGVFDQSCFQSGCTVLKRLFTRMLRRGLAGAAIMHATSTAEVKALRHWVPSGQIRMVPLGVGIPPDFDRDVAAAALYRRFPALQGKRLILFFSRVAPKKRPELLVEAIARLQSEFPNVALLVAGQDAGAMSNVQATARRLAVEDRVILAGFLEGDDKQGAFGAAAVFALPSVDENFGIAVVEAMAHRTPVLVTPGVATHVYVDESKCGETVDGTVEGVTEGLRRILLNDRDELGRRGRDFVARDLNWTAVAQQFRALYCECIGESTFPCTVGEVRDAA